MVSAKHVVIFDWNLLEVFFLNRIRICMSGATDSHQRSNGRCRFCGSDEGRRASFKI